MQLYWTDAAAGVNAKTEALVRKFELLTFMPFRLSRLAAEVSAELASEYRERHGLEIPEWRVLATLGYRGEARSAQYIVQCTRTHKSTISRAVTTLMDRHLIARVTNADDRRENLLCLTKQGQALFDQLVPELLAKEQAILSCLTAREQQAFNMIVEKIEKSMSLIHVGKAN